MRGLLGLVALAIGCDSRAGATDPQAGARAEQKSREYETCGATLHCQDNLRCFDHQCRRTARSTVGDYHAAVGEAARARGDLEAAITAYAAALGHYDAEKVAVPPDIDCAYGGALAAAKSKKEHAELGARVLHRCVLAAPPGGSMRDQAISQLATLGDSGLDPLLLGATKTADLYLTKAPQRPASDRLAVTVTAAPTPTARSFALISGELTDVEAKPGLVACWEAYTAATRKDALAVTLPIKVAYVPGEYEDDPSTFVAKLDNPSSSLAGADAAADGCVRGVVEPVLKSLKLADSFSAKVTISIK